MDLAIINPVRIGVFLGLAFFAASAAAQTQAGAYLVGRGNGMYAHISDAEAAIGTNNMGTVILTAGYTETITSTLNVGWNNGYQAQKGIKLIMMPGSTINENITNGSPGIVVYGGSSIECFGAATSGDIEGNPSTCQIVTAGSSVNMSAMVASAEIVTGDYQDLFGMQGITLNAGSATVTALADLGGIGGGSTVMNNVFFGGPNVRYLVHLHNNVGGGVNFQNNQLRGANSITGAMLYITGGEATGYQGVSGAMDIVGGEMSCTGPNAPAIKIDGDPDNLGRLGVVAINIHSVWTQVCAGVSGYPTDYITIHNASNVHIYDEAITTPSAYFFSISESAPGLSSNETFDNIQLDCNSPNCPGQIFIQDTTVGGYTHPIPALTQNIPRYGYVAHIQHDEAGEWNNPSSSQFNGKVGIGTANPNAMLGVQGTYDGSAPNVNSVPEINLTNGGAISLWMSNYAYSGSWLQSIQQYEGTNYLKNLYLQPLGGDVGIGTISPKGTLGVQGAYDPNSPSLTSTPVIRENSGGALSLWMSNYAYYGSWIQSIQDDGSQRPKSLYLNPLGGYVGIGTTNPGAALEVNGEIKFTGGSFGSITFPDGTKQATAFIPANCGADYAESVDVSGDRTKYAPGDVLVIDPNAPGKFLKSNQAYSTLVAGIYSTQPGFVGRLHPDDPKNRASEVPMAMVGRVPTKVSAENGAIHTGDLLVSSSEMGYAMKGTDRSRMLGAVIGKALDSLESGTGEIEVLVTLQ